MAKMWIELECSPEEPEEGCMHHLRNYIHLLMPQISKDFRLNLWHEMGEITENQLAILYLTGQTIIFCDQQGFELWFSQDKEMLENQDEGFKAWLSDNNLPLPSIFAKISGD